MQNVGKLLYVKTVAGRLCCTPKHVYRLIQDGKLDAIKLGSRGIRVYEASVALFVERSKIQGQDYDF
jgi:excisionase family DNA binding protein